MPWTRALSVTAAVLQIIIGDIIGEGSCQEIAEIGNDRFDGLQCIMMPKEFGEVSLNEAVLNARLIG